MWGGPLSGNSFVVVVINRFDVEKQILMNWSEDAKVPPGVYSVQVRDVSFHQGSLIRPGYSGCAPMYGKCRLLSIDR